MEQSGRNPGCLTWTKDPGWMRGGGGGGASSEAIEGTKPSCGHHGVEPEFGSRCDTLSQEAVCTAQAHFRPAALPKHTRTTKPVI